MRGDWAVARPGLAPGGWAFEFANVNYPDVDDTAEVVLALRRVSAAASAARTGAARGRERHGVGGRPRIDAAIGALRWVQGMQSSDGGWGAFDADNTRSLVRELPFLDFGEVIDEPSADVTAHAVEMLAALGLRRHPGRSPRRALAARPAGARRLVVRALGRQPHLRHRRGGAGADRRGRGACAGVHPPRGAAGSRSTRTRTAAGARTRAPTTIPRGSAAARAPPRRPPGRCSRCTRAGRAGSRRCARGVAWLVATQRADGSWDEPQYTGTGFPSDYYINYHLYRLVVPGRWRSAAACAAAGRCTAVATA